MFDQFQAQGGDPELLRPVIGVLPEHLAAALDEMGQRLGTIEGYFAEGLGLDEGAQSALRAAFLADDEAVKGRRLSHRPVRNS